MSDYSDVDWVQNADGENQDRSVDVLVHTAEVAQDNAYAPYSGFEVGAGILCDDGSIVTGYNVEVSGRTTSIHAEMMAMFKAIAKPDGVRPFHAIAITDSGENSGYGPCGLCLHTLSEFVDDIRIYIEDGGSIRSFNLSDEYNNSYRPQDSHERRNND